MIRTKLLSQEKRKSKFVAAIRKAAVKRTVDKKTKQVKYEASKAFSFHWPDYISRA
jgi:hypothetical protein